MTILAAYAVGYYLSLFVFLADRPWRRDPAGSGAVHSDQHADHAPALETVAVLVPARNEGERVLRVLRSLFEQDYAGPIEIYLLMKDEADSSAPYLSSAFPDSAFAARLPSGEIAALKDEPPSIELRRLDLFAEDADDVNSGERASAVNKNAAGPRRGRVILAGADGKSEKINRAVLELKAKFTAIIDCDHQADPAWIRSSLDLLREKNARFVQARRKPIFAGGLFRLWDSLHQHIGCELFNVAFARLGLTVFFTGTTAVLETRLLKENPLRICITEDADFSYQLVLNGEKIIHNPWHGSDEEVSPNLYSFFSRRRRWANGHTATFLRHLPRLRSAPIGWLARLQFLFHGLHYLVAPMVAVLHLGIGTYFAREMAPVHILAALATALGLATRFSYSRRETTGAGPEQKGVRFAEITALSLWFFPAFLIAMNLLLAILARDMPRAVLPVPLALQIVGLVSFAAPAIVLLGGLAGYRQLSFGTFCAVVCTYPLAFFLDIAGVLMGFSDLLRGWNPWHAITRTESKVGADADAGDAPNNAGRASGVFAAVSLEPVVNIRNSWRIRALWAAMTRGMRRGPSRLSPAKTNMQTSAEIDLSPIKSNVVFKYLRVLAPVSIVAFVIGALAYTPRAKIPEAGNACVVREHDSHPWIVAPEKLSGYCDESPAASGAVRAERTGGGFGTFSLTRSDDFRTLDTNYWDRMDATFECNLARFRPANVRIADDGEVRFLLEPGDFGDRRYASGSIVTKDAPGAQHLYGRFEVTLKPARVSGVLTAFFLYRFDPWQEIDAEFLGNDTTKLLLNVFYNPGEVGDKYNYGYRGTPVVIDLGFDAAEDFHTYAIEWDPDEIRWFVDDRLVHTRPAGQPTPIPHLPMRFHLNAWPICSEELAGPFDAAALPVEARFRSVRVYEYRPAAFPSYSRLIDSLLSPTPHAGGWRKDAQWLQPRP
ncbi:MAG: family 16 glycosylhydrolase [bacterium]|nr:family 16 glycosylhydrolase [bacterium]